MKKEIKKIGTIHKNLSKLVKNIAFRYISKAALMAPDKAATMPKVFFDRR